MMLAAIELERPWALLLLALPIALLLLVRLRTRPEEDATGTLEIWRRAALSTSTSAARSRRRVPPAIWLLCAAMVCAALAVAGPRPAPFGDILRIIVDRSPSMYFEENGETRLARALSLARPWIDDPRHGIVAWVDPPSHPLGLSGERFVAPGMDPRDLVSLGNGAWVPALEVMRVPIDRRSDPDFEAYDMPGTLWITDRPPEPPPRYAGYACSGGAAVPGPVGIRNGHLVVWDGQRLIESEQAQPPASVVCTLAPTDPVARVAQEWARARGYALSSNETDVAQLYILGAPRENEPMLDVVIGRDGWQAHALVGNDAPTESLVSRSQPLVVHLTTWLSDSRGGHTWVAYGDGVISTALTAVDRIEGDSAAFAVSWAALFDACVRLPQGCIPLDERIAAGSAVKRAPIADSERVQPENHRPAQLAFAGLVLAFVALASVMRRETTATGTAGRTQDGDTARAQ